MQTMHISSQRHTQSKKEHLKVIRIINAHILSLHSAIGVAVVEGDVVGPVLVALVHSAGKELLSTTNARVSTANARVSCLSPLSRAVPTTPSLTPRKAPSPTP